MRSAFLVPLMSIVVGCGGRDAVWEDVPSGLVSHGLDDAAAILDVTGERALMLQASKDLSLTTTSVPIQRGYATSATTPDGKKLVVLTRGDVPRQKITDQGPTLAVLQGGTKPGLLRSYELGDPLSGLAIDPESKFAVLFPSDADSSLVENPNELSIVNLDVAASETNPTPLTLRSFGGRPKSFFFTPTLGLPGGARRLLTVLTDRDIGLIDLSAPDKGDITVRLSSSGNRLEPVQVAVTDGDPARNDDARLAIRIGNDSSVILVDLLPAQAGTEGSTAHEIRPTPNVVFAGGLPSDIAFVSTDGGLRLAALVPSQNAMTLINPSTGIPSTVDLGAPFERMSIVTSVVGSGADGADVAMLWSTSSPTIAFVALGSTVGKPYKSVDTLVLEEPVGSVFEVPAPNNHLRILTGYSQQRFFVVDLLARTASPILAPTGAALTVAPDGLRAWLLPLGQSAVSVLDMKDLHPRSYLLGNSVSAAFDIARLDGGRALLAMHPTENVGVTVIDGEHPSLDAKISYSSVLLGDLR